TVCEFCSESELKHQQYEAARQPADCENPLTKPKWVDEKKMARGQAYFKRYFLMMFTSKLVSLMCILAYESILKVLRFTGKSSTPQTAYRRYLGTLKHIISWYSGDIWDPQSKAHRSLVMVRKMHTSSHRSAVKANITMTSQLDMVVTQWAFMGLALTHGQHLGMRGTKEELEGFVHFWRCAGYLLGIEDRFNLCRGTLDDVKKECHNVLHEHILPAMTRPPEGFESMSAALLNGTHMVVPFIDEGAFRQYSHYVIGLPFEIKHLGNYQRLLFNLKFLVYEKVLHIPVLGDLVRIILNFLLSLAINISSNIPSVTFYFTKIEMAITNLYIDVTFYILKFYKGITSLLHLDN
ncbi:unnamed protein product, partial [Meganyctiphanes norvegica]